MMTMISREAAIKMIESMTGDKSDVYSMAMDDAADALRSLPAVDDQRAAEPAQPVAFGKVADGSCSVEDALLAVKDLFPGADMLALRTLATALTKPPQMPPMSDEEITLLTARELGYAASNGLNMQQMALRLCRAVRGER